MDTGQPFFEPGMPNDRTSTLLIFGGARGRWEGRGNPRVFRVSREIAASESRRNDRFLLLA